MHKNCVPSIKGYSKICPLPSFTLSHKVLIQLPYSFTVIHMYLTLCTKVFGLHLSHNIQAKSGEGAAEG